MNSVLDFIQSLQEMKKSQLKWAGLALSERSEILRKISHQLEAGSASWAPRLAQQQSLPEEFVLQHELMASAKTFSKVADEQIPEGVLPKPTGMIAILLPKYFSVRVLAERLAPALLAGNGVYVLASEDNPLAAELFSQISSPEWPVRFFVGGDELFEILASHPGIQAVSFSGSLTKAEKLRQSSLQSWKKWQISAGYHNSALLLPDADLKLAASSLAESCFTGWGQLPWNISTIYVSESQLPEFQTEFFEVLSQRKPQPMSSQLKEKTMRLFQQLKSEKAKVLFGGGEGEILVVEDLSHCSILQQDCLEAPVVLLSAVKYAHEMVKWANTSYFGMYAQVFGSSEKVLKFASQLDVSLISANSWMESMESLPMGLKQSSWGLTSLSAFDGFFSDLRKIDGLESKI